MGQQHNIGSMLEAIGGKLFHPERANGVLASREHGEVRGVWVKQSGFGECHVMLATERRGARVELCAKRVPHIVTLRGFIYVRSESRRSLL